MGFHTLPENYLFNLALTCSLTKNPPNLLEAMGRSVLQIVAELWATAESTAMPTENKMLWIISYGRDQ